VLHGELAALVSIFAATAVGAATFIAAQRISHSPELSFFASGIRRVA
jgi:hypothetical protein